MQFRFLRLIDHVLGRALLVLAAPLCRLLGAFLPPRTGPRKNFTFIKLHGGGSLLIALPSLFGIRRKFPDAVFTLVCTDETRKYAELTGLFDRYAIVTPSSFPTLVLSGLHALAQCSRGDVCIDLEPHSFLAAVFTVGTLCARRLGFVKPNEHYRATAYTDALFFNPHAPIYVFYDQMAALLGAPAVPLEECRKSFDKPNATIAPAVPAGATKPVLYLAPFCSDFAPERMMPNELWPRLLTSNGAPPATVIIGGAPDDRAKAVALKIVLDHAFPRASILNLCGQRSLTECIEDIRASDAFWGINSGPLHIARLLGKPCRSFWGPTAPRHRLREVPGLDEQTFYLGFACSPCIDSVETSPCRGNNQCMRHFLEPPMPTPPIFIKASD